MKIHFIQSEYQNDLESEIQRLMSQDDIYALVVVACSENTWDLKRFSDFLKNQKKPIMGGIFPALVYNRAVYQTGALLIEVNRPVYQKVFHQLSCDNEKFEGDLMDFSLKIEEESLLMVYFDGLTEGIENFKESLFYNLGLSHQYVGGGTGRLDFSKTPSVISNEGLLMDAAVILAVKMSVGIGVAHGWHPITEEIKVSKAHKNVICELNGKPALQVYKEVIYERTGERLDPNTFFETSQKFPFGIARMNLDMVVRDPIACNEKGEIICVGDVPNGAFVHILTGNVRSLINGASEAKETAVLNYHGKTKNKGITLLIDCISRYLFLKEDYPKELDAIGVDDLVGALTFGEIANSGINYLELYNKTAVVCIMEV